MPTNTPGTVARELYTQQVHYIRMNITFESPTTVTVGWMPQGASIIDSGANISAAFNAGTANTVNIGITGDLADFGSGIDLSAAGVQKGVLTAADNAILASDQEVFATLSLTGTAATAGNANVWVAYTLYEAD